MNDLMILNPTEVILYFGLTFFGGYLTKYLKDLFINWLDKYFYIKEA